MPRKLIPAALMIGAILAAVGVYALVQAAAQRPMTGTILLWGGPNGTTCDATTNQIDLAGTGTLAHLGAVEVTSRNCSGADVYSTTVEITAGAATFKAADGSTVTSTFIGRQQPPAAGRHISAYTTTHTITGGTGRFANAAGTWTIAGTVDLSIGRLVGDVTGWLSY